MEAAGSSELPDYTVPHPRRQRDSHISWTVSVLCVFQNNDKGKHLLEHVCQQLNLIEKDYFGLRYVDHTRQRVRVFNLM
jgi:hypothetical protein